MENKRVKQIIAGAVIIGAVLFMGMKSSKEEKKNRKIVGRRF